MKIKIELRIIEFTSLDEGSIKRIFRSTDGRRMMDVRRRHLAVTRHRTDVLCQVIIKMRTQQRVDGRTESTQRASTNAHFISLSQLIKPPWTTPVVSAFVLLLSMLIARFYARLLSQVSR
jgi:hypothetical protein